MSDQGLLPPNEPSDRPDARMVRRAASVTLNARNESEDSPAMMDPANQSLADALRITYRLIQIAMLVLGALYLFSGFQSVRENEQGIRLLFGRKDGAQVDPGFRFSYPAPMGEMVKVDTGSVKVDLLRPTGKPGGRITADSMDFWVYLSDDKARETPTAQLPKTASLNPEREGSVLTGDGNIAHTKWSFSYTRDPAQVEKFAQNVLPEDERNIVIAAVKRGIVHAIAQTTIDDLLKQASGEGSVAGVAKENAQAVLDRLSTGIRLDQLKLEDKIPPMNVADNFAGVQTSESMSSAEREKARSEGNLTLNAMAGAAAGPLMGLITDYELAVEKNDDASKLKVLAAIDNVLEGREAQVATSSGDKKFPANLISGQVTTLLSDARQYRSSIVNQRRSDLSIFEAKLGQFKTSPLVMVHREWIDAYSVFLDRDSVQFMIAPPGLHTMELNINSDPDILKRIESAQNLRQGLDSAAVRAEIQKREKFKIESGIKATPN